MKVVIIPATYNEKGNIEKLISIIEEEVFPQIKNHDMQILVADDNSPDGTGEIVRGLMKKYKNLNISEGEKKGLGAAYIRAMTQAIEKMNADVVGEIDADLSHDPREIPKFLKKIDDGADIVIGTRYSDGGSMPQNWPVYRKAFSLTANIVVRLITLRFKIHDWTGGYRLIRKEVFLKEREKVRAFQGYHFQVGFLYKSLMDGFKVAEVPIHFADRVLGRSKIAPLEYIINLLKYVITERIKELQRFIKFLFVGGTGFIVQIIVQEGTIALGIASFFANFFNPKDPILSHSIGAGFGAEGAILSNFFLNNFWTFSDTIRSKGSSPFFVRLLKFNLSSLLPIGIQAIAVGISEKLFGISFMILGRVVPVRIAVLFPTIIFLVIPINYFIYNRFIWKTHKLKNESSP